jgi:two-component system sensor histidine kinase KdpD
MSLDDRPNPDALLAKFERDTAKARRGCLKIFFGAAAGVGKTFAMLQAARERRLDGVDVVVGLVDTHGRRETAALLEGLESLPTKAIEYRGVVFREFDLDGALKRKPTIILVDELAHTNAVGSRHPKRWQDIMELLDAGINVYTSLNVQHLESLNDDVGQIIGVRVWETVPDSVFEEADEIELVDLPPDELVTRLKEGKVYIPEQARHALKNFFRKGNLIALRELALRQTAHRVDAQMRDYREDHAIREVWQVGERILVCVGPSPIAERLIRAGKRLAVGLRSEWIVVYVETPNLQRLPAEKRDAVLQMLRLAEQLGAESVTLNAPDMGQAIIEFARERNVTKIVMGKPGRRGWRRWLMGSVVDTIIAEAHNINIYLLGSPRRNEFEQDEDEHLNLYHKAPLPGLRDRSLQSLIAQYPRYVWSLIVTLFCTLLAKGLFNKFDRTNLVMVYLLGIVFIAAKFGRGPSIMASVLGVAAFDFFFVNPFFTFSVADTQYLFTFTAILTVALTISHLMANVRYQAKVAAHRERRATVLYAMSKELSACRSEEEVIKVAVRHIFTEFSSRNTLLLPDENGKVIYPLGKSLEISLHGSDLSVAQWVYDHHEMAGKGTNTLPENPVVYFPMASANEVIGVLVMIPAHLRRVFLPEQKKLLDTFLDQIVHAIERVRLAEQAKAASVQMEAERLRNSLLSAISHDLRTPLATIVGSASNLVEHDASLQAKDRLELSRGILEEAIRMSSLINNILDMAKLHAGTVQLNRQEHSLEEIIETVLARLKKLLEDRSVTIKLPRDMPPIYADRVMIEQVLANLLENADRYTPLGSPIEISAERSLLTVTVSVADRGPGIPKGQEEQIFEKFHRVHPESAPSGVGLGLAICRAIVEAHGGWISAKNRGTGGAIFTFVLPQEAEGQPPSTSTATSTLLADQPEK